MRVLSRTVMSNSLQLHGLDRAVAAQEVVQRRRSPEDEEREGRPLGVDHDQLKATAEGDLLTTT